MTELLKSITVKPIITYPCEAQIGKTYLMTINLQIEEEFEWQYDEEDYPIYCTVDSELFKSKPIGEPVIVLHRFGGSYGEAKFLLTAALEPGHGKIKIVLINAWGVSIKVVELDQIQLLSKELIDLESDLIIERESRNESINTKTNSTFSGTKSLLDGRVTVPISSQAPRVFISYSHDSEEHMDQALFLANRLRTEGIDCSIDQYELFPAKGWHRWMMDEIEGADFVLMIFTAQYTRHFWSNEDNLLDMGVAWQGAIITQDLYRRQGKNLKYIPILFASEETDVIPKILRNISRYDLKNSKEYELLYRHLTNQPKTIKPELKILQKLPINERKNFFNLSLEKHEIKEIEYCNLPRKRYKDFVGRKQEIQDLLMRISPSYRHHINVVRGIGGVGKTSLVIEVANLCWEAKKDNRTNSSIPIFDAIIFTSSKATDLVNTQIINRPEKEPLLTDIFRVISDVLNEPTITQVESEQQTKVVHEVLAKQPTLLIVDSFDTISSNEQNIILSFLNNVPMSTQVIITTRNFLGFDGIVIKSLNKSESFDLLDSQANIKNISINNVWKKKFHKRFSGIPIALIYAIGKRAAGYSLTDIIDPTRMINKDLGRFCFENSVVLIKGTEAYKLFMAASFFSEAFCRDSLIKIAKLIDGHQNVIDAFAKLQQLSLITEENKGRYRILSITREYATLELEADENNEFKQEARERWLNWYLNFTKIYGGQDWEGWRAKYDHLDEEWENIQSVLYWYAEKSEWNKVLQLWENIDNYADLNGYWQDRRYWWALLEKNSGSTITRVKALSETGFILTLMGKYEDAAEYLNKAWDIHNEVDTIFQSTIANYLSVLSKCKKDLSTSLAWLKIEADLLKECSSENKKKSRYQVRNLYCLAEIHYLQEKKDIAKAEFEQVLQSCREIGWQRFKNYAKNSLAEIHIDQGDLGSAETLLRTGLLSATQAREKRRIALYQASYARLYYQYAKMIKEGKSQGISDLYISKAREFATTSKAIFSREYMLDESDKIYQLIQIINEY
jgi:tetratricopeptide (TPR) repeat protein